MEVGADLRGVGVSTSARIPGARNNARSDGRLTYVLIHDLDVGDTTNEVLPHTLQDGNARLVNVGTNKRIET